MNELEAQLGLLKDIDALRAREVTNNSQFIIDAWTAKFGGVVEISVGQLLSIASIRKLRLSFVSTAETRYPVRDRFDCVYHESFESNRT